MDQHKIIQRLNTMLTHSDYNEIDDFLNIGLLIEDINEQKGGTIGDLDLDKLQILADNVRVGIATDFVSKHKNTDLNDWLPNDHRSDHDRYLTILHNLNGGLYGDSEFNEDHMEIKIDGSDSRTGNPIIFDWYFMFEPPII